MTQRRPAWLGTAEAMGLIGSEPVAEKQRHSCSRNPPNSPPRSRPLPAPCWLGLGGLNTDHPPLSTKALGRRQAGDRSPLFLAGGGGLTAPLPAQGTKSRAPFPMGRHSCLLLFRNKEMGGMARESPARLSTSPAMLPSCLTGPTPVCSSLHLF